MRITDSERRAIAIAVDELRAYHEAVGNVDDADFQEYEKHHWAIRKLDALLERTESEAPC